MIDPIRAIQERAAKATENLPSVSLDNIDELSYVASIDIPWLCELALAYRERMGELAKALERLIDYYDMVTLDFDEKWGSHNKDIDVWGLARQILASRPESKESNG